MRNVRSQFMGLFLFLAAVVLVLSNGFVARISAQEDEDLILKIEPIGVVLHEVLRNYVEEPDTDKLVEGALTGMMNSLDDHSSFVSARVYKELREETEGEFSGIGVQIKLDDDKNIVIFQPILGSPAAKAGLMAGDIIVKIDGETTQGMSIDAAKERIRGESGTVVTLTVFRAFEDSDKRPEFLDIPVTRGRIPMESVIESRVLDGSIGYIRVSDFKQTTAQEIARHLKDLQEKGMKSLVLDLRWNPGGLLSASQEVAQLFLKDKTLVTYTRGRKHPDGSVSEDMTLYTKGKPVLPLDFPMVVLVNEHTASSSEIVTGALQFHKRALIVGMKTFGKGSVQTIIPLKSPPQSALRLTTALYYTPADVTINKHGILPDVEVPFPMEQWPAFFRQMRDSFESDPSKQHEQNHGTVTGNKLEEGMVEDVQLKRAVEILKEESVWDALINRYHKDVKITQVAAADAPPDVAPTESKPDQEIAAPQTERAL